jgi:hypothetical protein
MPKIKYIEKSFYKKSVALISEVNKIISEYQSQNYSLTLRQIYYQLVAQNIIPNKEESYDNLTNLIRDARLTGYIDWYSIEDRTRNLRGFTYWNSPSEFLREKAHDYRINPWEGQSNYVEVWVEKDALVDIVGQAASRYDVHFFACRGFPSISEMWNAAQRFISENKAGKKCVVIHLGDHDPSGLEMTRDLINRFETFGADVSVERIALNMDQIEKYNPPPNPAKTTDTRSKAYIPIYGTSSWELDALNPRVMDDLITSHILKYLDRDIFDNAKVRQDQDRAELLKLAI